MYQGHVRRFHQFTNPRDVSEAVYQFAFAWLLVYALGGSRRMNRRVVEEKAAALAGTIYEPLLAGGIDLVPKMARVLLVSGRVPVRDIIVLAGLAGYDM